MITIKLALIYIKKYKKRSFIIFLSFLFAVIIACTNGIMKHSANIIGLNEQKKYNPYHLKIINASKDEIDMIRKNQDIKRMKIRNFIGASDANSLYRFNVIATSDGLNDSALLSGTVAKNEHEVTIEKWIADNLHKKIGDSISYTDYYTKKHERKIIVGLLKDNNANKASSIFNMNTISQGLSKNNTVDLEFKDSSTLRSDINNLKNSIINEYNHKKSDITTNKMLITAYENDGNLLTELIPMLLISILFSGLIVFSTYFISMRKRIRDIGILRAFGIMNFDIISIIIVELMTISFPSIAIGILISIFSAKFMTNMGYNLYSDISLINIGFADIKVPPNIVFATIMLIFAVVVIIAIVTYFLSIRNMPINTIHTEIIHTRDITKFFGTKNRSQKKSFLIDKLSISNFLSLRYMRSDMILMCIMIACMSITTSEIIHKGCIAEINNKIYKAVTEPNFGVGDIIINKSNPYQSNNSVDDTFIDYFNNIDGIKSNFWTSYKYTRMTVPSSLVRNTEYFDDNGKSNYVKEVWNGMYKKDGDSYIIKNKLLGFNDDSLKFLKNNIIKGDINLDKLHNTDTCILFYPKNYINLKTGYDKRNEILNYKVGDTITIDIPVEFDIGEKQGDLLRKYWTLEFTPKTMKKSFKISAIIDSMPFRIDYSIPSTDVVISQKRMLSIDKNEKYCLGAIKLENNDFRSEVNKILLEKFSNVPGFLVEDNINYNMEIKNSILNYLNIENIKYYAFIIVCVFSFINMIGYKILDKKRELAILRALGTTDIDIKNILIYEGIIYSFVATALSWIIAFARQVIYTHNLEIKSHIVGIDFRFNIMIYLLVFAFHFILCMMSTYIPSKKILRDNIKDSIGGLE